MSQNEANPKVLVVDDDDAIRVMVERVLKREKYHVECARDGQEAIEKLHAGRYDTVLLDLMMPRVDGHGVIRFLEGCRDRPVPTVILMTANLQSAAESAAAPPVVRVLSKPFDIAQLIAHVRECQRLTASTPCGTGA